jgi:hypothetical protein
VTAEQRMVLKVAIDRARRARIKAEDRREQGLIRSYRYEHGEIENPAWSPERREAMSRRAKAARAGGNARFGQATKGER